MRRGRKMKCSRGWVFLAFVVLAGTFVGCGGSSDDSGLTGEAAKAVDSAKEAVDETVEGAMKDAEATLDSVKAELADKEAMLAELTEKIQNLSPEDLMGEQGQAMKAKAATLTDEIAMLKEKLESLM
jgi:hypothetical protein